MATAFDSSAVQASAAREALRHLAHTTRRLDDANEIYPLLGDLALGLESLAQSLHQIGSFHDAPSFERTWTVGDGRMWRAASYEVAWELHRAAEMAHQVAAGIDRAHEVEAGIRYRDRKAPDLHSVPSVTTSPGFSL